MNFDFTDDQQAIKRTANELLAARFKPERVRELAEAGGYDDDAWKEMAELGWAGIFIDEEHSGQGLRHRRAGDPDGGARLRAGAGSVPVERRRRPRAPVRRHRRAEAALAAGHRVRRGGTVGMLRDGEARLVPDADSAEVIVLIGSSGSTSVVEVLAAEVEPFETMDRTRRFARVRADGGEPLGGDCFAAGDRIATALAAGDRRSRRRRWRWLSSTPATASSSAGRSGPTRPRCAQMLLEVGVPLSRVLRGLVRRRRAGVARGGRLDGEGVLVGCRLARLRLLAPGAHGGIGFTWEHDLRFYLKRAKTNAMYGSREHRERVARLSLATESATAAA